MVSEQAHGRAKAAAAVAGKSLQEWASDALIESANRQDDQRQAAVKAALIGVVLAVLAAVPWDIVAGWTL